jgi:hypothetical protein
MASILDMTIKDLLALLFEGGGEAGKFVGRGGEGQAAIVVALAYGDSADDFAAAVDDFLEQSGGTQPVGEMSVDDALAHTQRLLTPDGSAGATLEPTP